MTVKDFFLKMLSSIDPTVSSARFLSLVTVIGILYAWMIVCLLTRTLHDIPGGVCTFAGIVIAGSVGNKAFEKTATGSTTTETSTTTVTK